MKAAVGGNEGMRGPCGRKDTEPSKGPGVKVSEKRPSTDCGGETELEQSYRRNEGKDTEVQHIWLATLSPRQSDHTSSADSLAVLSHSISLSRLGVCLLPSAPALSSHTSYLDPLTRHLHVSPFSYTDTYCMRTHTHTDSPSVSVSLSGGRALQLGAKRC